VGPKTTTLRLTSDDVDEAIVEVALQGTGIMPPDIDVDPTAHDYGTVAIGATVSRTITIRNVGTADLQVTATSLVGGEAAEFAIASGSGPFTVVPGATHTLDVRFAPTSGGSKTTTLRLTSDDPDENPFLIALTGTTPPVFEEVRGGGSEGSNSVTTDTSLMGVTGNVYLAAVSSKPYREVSTVMGLGLTWTRVTTQCAGRSQTGVDLWWAQGTATTGTVTATLESAPNNAAIAVARYSGAASTNPVTPLVAGNTNGVNGSCAGGRDDADYSFNVTPARNNAVIFTAVALRNKTHNPGAGYTTRIELTQGSGGNTAGIAVFDGPVPIATPRPLNGSLNSAVDWAVIGVELLPQ
jgi:hypothetical protein